MAKRFADLAFKNTISSWHVDAWWNISTLTWKRLKFLAKFCVWNVPKYVVYDILYEAAWGGFAEGLGIREPSEEVPQGDLEVEDGEVEEETEPPVREKSSSKVT
jgi:hypothetical protein